MVEFGRETERERETERNRRGQQINAIFPLNYMYSFAVFDFRLRSTFATFVLAIPADKEL